MAMPAFLLPPPLRPSTHTPLRALTPRRLRAPRASAEGVPASPASLLQSWKDSRKLSSTRDLSRRFISVLFLSNQCERAAYAEKQLGRIAESFSVSRRLLILSAGLHSSPGDLLPWRIVAAAKEEGVDLSDEQPCASFDISDLEYYDFIVAVDRDVKDQVMMMAEVHAQVTGGHLYEWERKVRLLCDFDNSSLERNGRSAGSPLDVPTFSSAPVMQVTMEVINVGCNALIRSLLSAGL